jgi:hypothetical protein
MREVKPGHAKSSKHTFQCSHWPKPRSNCWHYAQCPEGCLGKHRLRQSAAVFEFSAKQYCNKRVRSWRVFGITALPAIASLIPSRSSSCGTPGTGRYVIDFAFKSVFLKASTELMSGFAAPARTATQVEERARAILDSAMVFPFLISPSKVAGGAVITSNVSPASMRAANSALSPLR